MHFLQSWSFPARLVAAIGIFAACLGLRFLILPVEAGLAFLTFHPGTALVALLCGIGPTLVYIMLAGIVGAYIFLPPYWSFEVHNLVPLFAFLISATTIFIVIHYFQRRIAQHIEKLRAATATLLAREAELADAQRIAKLGSWTWDARTKSTLASAQVCRIFGRDNIPSFAEQDGTMFPHTAWEALLKGWKVALDGGLGYDLELPAFHADGHQIWVNSRSEVIRDADGNVTGLRGMVQDITERKANESIVKSERFIRFITDSMPTLVAYWDKNLRCQFANQPYINWWGKTADYIKNVSLKELMGESLFTVNEGFIKGVLAGEYQHFERYLTKPDGSVGHVLANYVPDIDCHGNVRGFIIIGTDIKALRLAQAELKLATNIYQNIAEGVMVTNTNGVILSVNPAFTEITGYPAQEAVGKTPRLLRSERHAAEFYASIWKQITAQGQWKGEIWNRRKCGDVFLVWQTITKIAGDNTESSRYVSVFHDITDTWKANEDNRHLAFHDALTKLPNRALLMERLERRISTAEREPLRIAIMFLDLDRFKLVNDTLGHAVGDELLIVVANRLQALVRHSDTVARLGGDEFIIKLYNPASQDEVVQIVGRVISVINDPVEIQGHHVQVGASVGIAMYPDDGATASELIASADSAMYVAKHAGKNRYQFFAPDVT
jgi:diguanylate cyclase (GGDEF)-like protein/PAS domain S-box-containing protein